MLPVTRAQLTPATVRVLVLMGVYLRRKEPYRELVRKRVQVAHYARLCLFAYKLV